MIPDLLDECDFVFHVYDGAIVEPSTKEENALVEADITVNKNMVPFDDKSPFVTSGIRVGTAAVTTRGMKEADMAKIVDFIDKVLINLKSFQAFE